MRLPLNQLLKPTTENKNKKNIINFIGFIKNNIYKIDNEHELKQQSVLAFLQIHFYSFWKISFGVFVFNSYSLQYSVQEVIKERSKN